MGHLIDVSARLLDSGECNIGRSYIENAATINLMSGDVHLVYFDALRSEPINTFRTATTGSATTTPTLARIGIYSEDANGDLTLVAATANNTAMWSVANTVYSEPLTTTWEKIHGRRYAAAFLHVSAGTPTLLGRTHGSGSVVHSFLDRPPRLLGRLTGQTDLPASIAAGALFVSRIAPFVEMTP